MDYARLGATDLVVSRIGFGCEPLGGTDWGPVDEKVVFAAVEKALGLGINFFDTADVYGLGRSEEKLFQALGRKRHEVIIATKFGVSWRSDSDSSRARTYYDSSPRRVVEALEGSLRRLRLDRIPLYQINWPDQSTPIADTMEALRRCQEVGKIGYIGCCNFSPIWIREAHRVTPLASLQAEYSLLERTLEQETLACCEELGIGVLVWGPLAQGLLTGKFTPGVSFGADDRRSRLGKFQGEALERNLDLAERLRAIGQRYGRTPPQVALRWILDNPSITCAITGIKDPSQVEENVAAIGWSLSEQDRTDLAREVA